jgi:hypothetical protein
LVIAADAKDLFDAAPKKLAEQIGAFLTG